ncbi:MAG: TetR family transcriptional regulator [Acidobacteria bacterium]|nr:TetR family transcriptional regulator [Acidobacteriota bacterium]
MPKISAPTVAEHRSRQRTALLQAATDILVTDGINAVTPAAVGAAAGLARPSVYQYFSSGAAIIAAIIEDVFPRANQILAESLAVAGTPEERLDAYIRETLRLAAEGYHRPASALAGAALPPECLTRLMELHHEQAAPFIQALSELGIPDLPVTARLLGGIIEVGMTMVESGQPLAVVTERTTALIHGAIKIPAGRQPV